MPVKPPAAATTPSPRSSENPKSNTVPVPVENFKARQLLPVAETTDPPQHEPSCVSPEGREMAIPRMKVR